MCMKFCFLVSLISVFVYHARDATAQMDGAYEFIPGFVNTDVEYSKKMMERQEHVTDKAVVQLKAAADGTLQPYRLYVGGRAVGTFISEKTNTDGKFPILSRLPPTHSSGDEDSYGVINDITVDATAVLPWVTGFVQGEYTEIEYPIQSQKQIRQYWVTLGDLGKFPLYLTAGKKSVNFGNFDSYAPFTHTHSAHYFWAQSDAPLIEAGYVNDKGTMVSASLIKNDRGIRVLNSPDNDGSFKILRSMLRKPFRLDMMIKTRLKWALVF